MSDTTAADTKRKYRIVVNGEPSDVDSDVVTYDQVVKIAYPNGEPGTEYTVTFDKGKEPREGDLLPGGSVEIKDGTEFDVTPTGKS
jgi:hypothetical protein